MMIQIEKYRCPIKLELVRHVLPLLGFCCAVACLVGYKWAWNAFSNGILR